MSKKVVKWMIADLVCISIITLLFLWFKKGIISSITNETAQNSVNIILWIIYAIVDIFILIWFLIYWWSDRKWTKLKCWGNKQISNLYSNFSRR